MLTQNQTGDLKQTRTGDTSRSPKSGMSQLEGIRPSGHPNLAYFAILVLGYEN